MPSDESILVREKIAQAISLLERFNLDLWLTFVHETSLVRDPALDLVCPYNLTWPSAVMVHRGGESVAIVGRYDAANLERLQAFTRVVGYDQSVRPLLIDQLRTWRPRAVGLNISRSDPASSGLTHGLKLVLDEILRQADIGEEQVVSAEGFLGSLRGQKTPREVEGVRAAVATTEALIGELTGEVRVGRSERQLADFLHGRMRSLDLQPSWDWETDPAVNTGPESGMGHAGPSDLVVAAGHLVHIDFGVRQSGFCADLQRMWYVLRPGETQPPAAVQQAWALVRRALLSGADALRPGARGWEVDQAARRTIVAGGAPEYKHAFGHHLGRATHDGATTLGPHWERYGTTPDGVIEAGNVFAIELGAEVAGHGWVNLEEDVLVTDSGIEWLSSPQTDLWLVSASA
jgi:Xaa-Pro aminopeptidase